MFSLSPKFEKAVADYFYLLEKGYPQKSILKIVGNRYQLVSTERSMLYRGVVTRAERDLRKVKKLRELPAGSNLTIDGYNVIRTMGSYLTGKPVFVSMDGFLRDAAEMHKSTLKKKILDRTLEMLFNYLHSVAPQHVVIYLDEPISKSGELSARLNKLFKQAGLTGNALTTRSPDYHLKEVENGIICTADSAVIDSCKVPVFDLAKAILNLTFQPKFINLEKEIYH